MGVERVDYYSDEEYQQALQYEEDYYRRNFEKIMYESHIAELDYFIQDAKHLIDSYDTEQRMYLFSLYCMKCGYEKKDCICQVDSPDYTLPF